MAQALRLAGHGRLAVDVRRGHLRDQPPASRAAAAVLGVPLDVRSVSRLPADGAECADRPVGRVDRPRLRARPPRALGARRVSCRCHATRSGCPTSSTSGRRRRKRSTSRSCSAAFLLLARALDRPTTLPRLSVAGLAFGAAALTRIDAALLRPAGGCPARMVVRALDRRRGCCRPSRFVVGFPLLTAPYSVALSRHFGQITIIDTHGSIHLDSASGTRAPSLFETAAGLWQAMSAEPGAYFSPMRRARAIAAPRQRRPHPPDLRRGSFESQRDRRGRRSSISAPTCS